MQEIGFSQNTNPVILA